MIKENRNYWVIKLSIIDMVIIALYLLFVVLIGLFATRIQTLLLKRKKRGELLQTENSNNANQSLDPIEMQDLLNVQEVSNVSNLEMDEPTPLEQQEARYSSLETKQNKEFDSFFLGGHWHAL
jgi:hypothetical protein